MERGCEALWHEAAGKEFLHHPVELRAAGPVQTRHRPQGTIWRTDGHYGRARDNYTGIPGSKHGRYQDGQDSPPLHERRQMGHTREPRLLHFSTRYNTAAADRTLELCNSVLREATDEDGRQDQPDCRTRNTGRAVRLCKRWCDVPADALVGLRSGGNLRVLVSILP